MVQVTQQAAYGTCRTAPKARIDTLQQASWKTAEPERHLQPCLHVGYGTAVVHIERAAVTLERSCTQAVISRVGHLATPKHVHGQVCCGPCLVLPPAGCLLTQVLCNSVSPLAAIHLIAISHVWQLVLYSDPASCFFTYVL